MIYPLHILTKKALVWVVVSIFILVFFPISIAAVKLETVSVDTRLNITLDEEGSGDIVYELDIHNSDQAVVSGMQVNLPFSQVQNLQVSLGSSGLPFKVATQDGFTMVDLQFEGAAIRATQSNKLVLHFSVPNVVSGEFGFHQLYIPKQESDYAISTSKLIVNYPSTFFAPTYLSVANLSNNPNQIEMSSLHGYLAMWGDEAVYDIHAELGFNTNPEELSLNILNLPMITADQDVIFTELSKQVDTIGDQSGNLWGMIDYDEQDKQVTYTARVHRFQPPRQREVPIAAKLPDINIPADLQTLIGNNDELTKLRYLYGYIVDTYAPVVDNTTLDVAADGFWNTLPERKSLHGVEYAYLLSSYAQSLGIQTRIAYGYLMGLSKLGDFTTDTPIVYVEAWVDGQVVILDPFLEDVSGFEMFDAPFFDRIQMGIWDLANKFDSVLGIFTKLGLKRPSTVDIGAIDQTLDYTMAIDFPEQIVAGNYYQGKLMISNSSGHIIKLESILLNGKEYLGPVVTISENYYHLIRPVGDTELTLEGLIEEDLFSNNSRSGKITVKPVDTVFPTKTAAYSVSFRANVELVIAGIGLGVGAVTVIGFWLYRRGLRKRRLTRSYIESQEMLPAPILN